MSDVTLGLSAEMLSYLQNHSVQEPELLAQLREQTHRDFASASMQISPEQGQLFRFILEVIAAKKVLDIGTFTGYSSLWMALSLPEDGQIVCCDIDVESTNVAKKYWQLAGVENKVTLQLAPATETLAQLIADKQANTFDFAFIDADKENYSQYYEDCVTLVRPGGIIAVDNVLWSGAVVDPKITDDATNAIRKTNELIYQDPRVTMCMLPIGDGLTLARKK